MSNPNPPKEYQFTSDNAAEMGAKGGTNKKGSKHLSTLIREIGENIDWDKTTLKDKEKMKENYGNRAWDAVVYVAFTKGMAGDIKAMDWLAKNGYGQKIDITSGDEPLKISLVEFVDGNNKDKSTTTD